MSLPPVCQSDMAQHSKGVRASASPHRSPVPVGPFLAGPGRSCTLV